MPDLNAKYLMSELLGLYVHEYIKSLGVAWLFSATSVALLHCLGSYIFIYVSDLGIKAQGSKYKSILA